MVCQNVIKLTEKLKFSCIETKRLQGIFSKILENLTLDFGESIKFKSQIDYSDVQNNADSRMGLNS